MKLNNKNNAMQTLAEKLYPLIVIIAVWYLLHYFTDSRIVPAPHIVLVELVESASVLMSHVIASMFRILIAIFIILGIGIPLGLWISTHERVDRFVSPIIYALYPVPKIAFLPLFMLFFGLGDTSKIILICTILIFQILLSIRDSVKGLNKEYFYAIKSLGANTLQIYRHMIFPVILPNILTALRISVGTSISVLFFAENYATAYGVGYFIMDSWMKLDYTAMFAGIVAISLMGIVIFKGIDFLERGLCKWKIHDKFNSPI